METEVSSLESKKSKKSSKSSKSSPNSKKMSKNESNSNSESDDQHIHSKTNSSLSDYNDLPPANSSYKIINKQDPLNPTKRVVHYIKEKSSDEFETDTFLPPNSMDPVDLLYVPKNCAESVEQFAKYVWETGWRAIPHHSLPNWLRDNDFLLKGHRPPLPSIKACLESVFRIHTETGNIWTHFIGAISFIGIAIYFLSRPNYEVQFQEKFVFGTFFMGAIVCLMCSTLFHTFYCYSPSVSKIFNKIDYAGISVLTMGSFVPWLYYAFYCEVFTKIGYLVLIAILGSSCIVVSLWDKFSEPRFRVLRAGMFIALGLSGLIPAIHYIITFGSYKAFNVGALGWLVLMAFLYIAGACLYAFRIPERLFPGKFDIWSHQIFHVFVVAAAYVHYHGITKLASYRLTIGDCLSAHIEADFSFEF